MNYWAVEESKQLAELDSSRLGLSSAEAEKRLKKEGKNTALEGQIDRPSFFKNLIQWPVLLGVLIALFLAYRGQIYPAIIQAILLLFVVFFQTRIQERSRRWILSKESSPQGVQTRREGAFQEVNAADLVPGDIIRLYGGDRVPANARVLAAKDVTVEEGHLFYNQMPQEKWPDTLTYSTAVERASNMLWRDSYLLSGSCEALVLETQTDRLAGIRTENKTDKKGRTRISRTGQALYYLLGLVSGLVFYLLTGNLDGSLLLISTLYLVFRPSGLDLAQTLLAKRSLSLAEEANIHVDNLETLFELEDMDTCLIDADQLFNQYAHRLDQTLDAHGQADDRVFLLANLAATFQEQQTTSLNQAIRNHRHFGLQAYKKIDELPYSMTDRIQSLLIQTPEDSPFSGERLIISYGPLDAILSQSTLENPGADHFERLNQVIDKANSYKEAGYQVFGLATKPHPGDFLDFEDVFDLDFQGFLLFESGSYQEAYDFIQNLQSTGRKIKWLAKDQGEAQALEGMIDQSLKTVRARDLFDLQASEREKALKEADLYIGFNPVQVSQIIELSQEAGHKVLYLLSDTSSLQEADQADLSFAFLENSPAVNQAADLSLSFYESESMGILEALAQHIRTSFSYLRQMFFLLVGLVLPPIVGAAMGLPVGPAEIFLLHLFALVAFLVVSRTYVRADLRLSGLQGQNPVLPFLLNLILLGAASFLAAYLWPKYFFWSYLILGFLYTILVVYQYLKKTFQV